MRGSLCQVKRVLDEATSTKPLGDGREIVPLLSSIQHFSKFGTDQKRRERTEARLLHQLGISRCRGKLPKDGKDSFRIIGHLQKTPSLFASTPHCRHAKPTHKKDDEQDRRNKMTYLMGN